MTTRKEALLRLALEYFLEHGVADATLRPLAQKIGTSARLLVYHFGSKEGLLKAAMEEVESHFQRFFLEIVDDGSEQTGPFHAFWRWAKRPVNLSYFRLLFEIQVLALQKPKLFARHAAATSNRWLELIESELPPAERGKGKSTLYLAVFDGLILELLATGDHRRVEAAFGEFNRLLSRPALAPHLRRKKER